jgi:hypothetical protein
MSMDNPRTHAEREAAQRADEHSQCCAVCNTPFTYCTPETREQSIYCTAVCWGHCDACPPRSWRETYRAMQGAAQRADEADRCAICKERPVNPDDGVLCDPCFAHYNSHGDDPCPTCPPFTEHTHPCPTCHHARSCTCTVFAPGEPLECATCSNCRGW